MGEPPKLDNSTESASTSSEEPPRRLWSCPQGYVGKDQCDASHHNSNCCGYSIPGENCGDRADDCFCYQWNCHGPVNSLEALPKPDNSTEVVSIEEPPRRLWVCPQGCRQGPVRRLRSQFQLLRLFHPGRE